MDRDRSRPTASHLISSPSHRIASPSLLNEEWQPWYDIAGGRAIPIFPADGGASSQITKGKNSEAAFFRLGPDLLPGTGLALPRIA
jgi:hypothetical protein